MIGEPRPFEIGNSLVEDPGVAGRFHIFGNRICEPHRIVGDARTNALPRGRQPPVLNIALGKLATGSAEDMLPGNFRRGVG